MAAFSVERHGPDEQLRGAEEHRDALVPGHRRPAGVRVPRGVDRALDVRRVTFGDVGEHVIAIVGHHRVEGRAGLDALAADHERDLDPLARHLGEPPLELGALGRPGLVRADRLVDGGRSAEDARGGHGADCRVGVVEVTWQRQAVRHRYEVAAWGVGELVVRDGVLIAHALPSRRRRLSPPLGGPHGGASTPEDTVSPELSQEDHPFVSDLCRRFAEHLSGGPVSYDDVVVEEDAARPVPARAARRCAIDRLGERRHLRRPRGPRRPAARGTRGGSFCARNLLSLVVPCHRVVAAGRDEPYVLGPYGPSGAHVKRRLLALEGTLL